MELFWLQPDLTAYQEVVRVTVCTVVRVCVKNVLDGSTPDQYQIQLVPVLWAQVSPGDLVLRLGLEEGVSDAQVVKDTEFKQSLSILIHFPHSKRTKARGPQVIVCTHSGIEVGQENELLSTWDVPDSGCKVLIEFILGIWSGKQHWGIHTGKDDWALGGVKA